MGADDGLKDGAAVGPVGAIVEGGDVGDRVGVRVGFKEGAAVGSTVGNSLAAGPPVGDPLSALVCPNPTIASNTARPQRRNIIFKESAQGIISGYRISIMKESADSSQLHVQ